MEMAEEKSAPHTRIQPQKQQPMSLNQRHRMLIDLSSTSHSKPFPKIVQGGENGENQGRVPLFDAFSLVAENGDIPSFSGITEFDSPSPPKPLAAGGESKFAVEEADVPTFSGIADFDSPIHPPADETKELRNVESSEVSLEDDNTCEAIKPSFSVTSTSVLDPQGTQEKPVKVKIAGRRRLCKISKKDEKCDNMENGKSRNEETKFSEISDFDSPPQVRNEVQRNYGSGQNEIRDILDDLSSRLEILSIEKKRGPKKTILNEDSGHPFENDMPMRKEEFPEYGSAASSFTISSDSSLSSGKESRVGGAALSELEQISDSDKELDNNSFLLKDRGGKNFGEGLRRNDANTIGGKSICTTHSSRSTILRGMEEEEEDDDCVLMSGNSFIEVERGEVNSKLSNFSNEIHVPEDHANDYILEDQLVSLKHPKLTYRLPAKIAKFLYPHQREGLNWLWSLYCKGKGGILGDDMGLGKTMQICAFLAGLFHSNLIKRALIVAPKTLLPHWTKELSVVGLSEKTREYFGTNVNARQYELQYVLQDKGVLLTTYDIVRNNAKSLSGCYNYNDDGSEDEITWDYMILDEGHLIKNPNTQRAKSLLEIPSAHRIIISGTPLQNNLKELWALFNFCCPELLGDKNWFRDKYERLINRGNEKNASDREKHVGSAVAKDLRDTIQPYFLRRLKSEVFSEDGSGKEAKLSKKNEIIVWLKLTGCQRQLYEAFLKSEIVLSAFDGSPLAALTILKKICDHPLLLTKRAAEDVLEGMDDSMMNQPDHGVAEKLAMHIADVAEKFEMVEKHDISCKTSFILSLLDDLIPKGHRVLIFSQTRKMLNLIQESLISSGYDFMRIDGTTKACDRLKIVNDFQEGHGASIFLLTSQVGGLGLTLTKADRVIVVDPAWNPSTDNQSVDRAYRIGQKKDVIVYRLMTCGTVEEKIYRMQIFKGGLFRTATEHKEQIRYFSKQDLKELFSLPKQGFDISLTQKQLLEEHDQQYNMEEPLKMHVEFLESLGIAGVSQHSLLFSKTASVPAVAPEEVSRIRSNTVMINSSSHSPAERFDGAQYAFRPKDLMVQQKKLSPRASEPTENEIRERINRLSRILANKDTTLRLPDKGERIYKQIAELKSELDSIQVAKTTEKRIIELDDISGEFQRALSMK